MLSGTKFKLKALLRIFAMMSLVRADIEVIKWKEAWPEEAIHVNFAGRMWSGGVWDHYASEISDRKLP